MLNMWLVCLLSAHSLAVYYNLSTICVLFSYANCFYSLAVSRRIRVIIALLVCLLSAHSLAVYYKLVYYLRFIQLC